MTGRERIAYYEMKMAFFEEIFDILEDSGSRSKVGAMIRECENKIRQLAEIEREFSAA